MKVLLIMNGSRERYAGGADKARYEIWLRHCSSSTQLEMGYLPSEAESNGISKAYAFGNGQAVANLAQLYPERCVQAERDGYDAVIMHCCSDPGLREARARVRIPIIGPGETSLRKAAAMSDKIGITAPSSASVGHHWRQVDEVGVRDYVIGIEPIDQPIPAYRQQDAREMTEALLAAAQRLVKLGANIICPSGFAYIPVRVSAREVSEQLGVPVLDPALVSVEAVEELAG